MKIFYQFDKDRFEILENPFEDEIEFTIIFKKEDLSRNLEKIHDYFRQNAFYTDALFSTYNDNSHQVIVKNKYYIDFILQLFKQELIHEIHWE